MFEKCKINASSKEICDRLKDVVLEEDEEVISYDVVSLYTNVPVLEAITVCADLLYNLPSDQRPVIDKDTFILSIYIRHFFTIYDLKLRGSLVFYTNSMTLRIYKKNPLFN